MQTTYYQQNARKMTKRVLNKQLFSSFDLIKPIKYLLNNHKNAKTLLNKDLQPSE